MAPKRTIISCQKGVTALLFGILAAVLITTAGLTIDYSRGSIVRNLAQHSLDSAALAVVTTTDPDNMADITEEANNFFRSNQQMTMQAQFQPVAVARSADRLTYTLTVQGRMPNYIMPLFGGPRNRNINLTTRITRESIPVEIAMIMDSSDPMNQGRAATGILNQMKTVATTLVNTLYADPRFTSTQSAISVISYSDAIRVPEPQRANFWQLAPYSNTNAYNNLCLTTRGQNNRYNLTASNPFVNAADSGALRSNASSLFPRYRGPFDYPNSIRFFSDTFNAGGQHVFTPINYVETIDGDANVITLLDPQNQYVNSSGQRVAFNPNARGAARENIIPLNLYKSALNVGRFGPAIDFITRDASGRRLNDTEGLLFYFTDSRTGVPRDMIGTTLRFNAGNLFGRDPPNMRAREIGAWEARNISQQLVGAADFRGPIGGNTVSVSTDALRNTYYHFIKFYAKNDSDTTLRNDIAPWPRGPQIAPGASILDNSDYLANVFYIQSGCGVQPSLFLSNNRNAILNKIASLNTGGPARANVGLAWGWYTLDPSWRGIITGNTQFPKNYGENNKKIAILMVREENFLPSDDAEFQQMCTNMKRQGITIYTVAFDPRVIPRLQQCATDASHFYGNGDMNALLTAFKQIGQRTSYWRIVQ